MSVRVLFCRRGIDLHAGDHIIGPGNQPHVTRGELQLFGGKLNQPIQADDPLSSSWASTLADMTRDWSQLATHDSLFGEGANVTGTAVPVESRHIGNLDEPSTLRSTPTSCSV